MHSLGKQLDFIVIGAPRSGTTSLWYHLRGHPMLHLPPDKEAPYFTSQRYAKGSGHYLGQFFRFAAAHKRWGTVSPQYMVGAPSVPVELVAERMRETAPRARLVALLRDPTARAMSEHREASRSGQESRTFESAVEELLAEELLEAARARPEPTNTYVVAGEYGRVLSAYLEHFPREQLQVVLTSDLERDPEECVASVFEHIGVDPGHRPPDLTVRARRGGARQRVGPGSTQKLRDFLEEKVWSVAPKDARPEARRAFDFWVEGWNVEPGGQYPTVERRAREALAAHFRADAELLERATGVEVPWAGTPDAAGSAS